MGAHFRQSSTPHPDYSAWMAEKKDQEWVGKSEPLDYVECRECGLKAGALVGHIKAKHGIPADEYRAKHPGSRIRSDVSRAKRNAALKRARGSRAYRGTKTSPCSECGVDREIPKFSSAGKCLECLAWEETLRWENLTEPFDYVECVECGYRAENLTSHITSSHPNYRRDYPEAIVVALNSPIRDKTALKGRVLSEETRRRMSEAAGRWNAGLTKESDPRVAAMAGSIRKTFEDGRESWSKGLTAKDHPSLQSTVAKLKLYVGVDRPWRSRPPEDLSEFYDSKGRVDRTAASQALGVSYPTVTRWIHELGLEPIPPFESTRIRLLQEELEPFAMKHREGRIHIGSASKALGVSSGVVRREVLRNGLIPARGRVKQALCLHTMSQALGGLDYVEEWKDRRFTNPDTGWRFRYDGFFKEIGLVVEFHGHQHYEFPNAFHKTDTDFRAGQQRDRLKRGYIDGASGLVYMMVRADTPFDSIPYLRGRLVQAGILSSYVRLLNPLRRLCSVVDPIRLTEKSQALQESHRT